MSLLITVAFAAWNTSRKSIWTDESYSLHTAQGTLAQTWHHALHFELQPPVYFLALHGWLQFDGAGVVWARAFSTLCVLAAILVLWRASRGWFTGQGIPAPLLAAVVPTFIWAAAEARDYALLLLLASILYALFLALVSEHPRHVARTAVLYGIVSYLALLTMYYAGFVLLGQWVASMMLRRGRRPLTLALAVVGLAMLPWLPTIIAQASDHANLNLPLAAEVARHHTPGGAPTIVMRELLGAVFAASPALDRGLTPLLFLLLLAAVPIIRLGSTRDEAVAGDRELADWSIEESALATALAASTFAFVILRVTNVTLVLPRHMTALTPGFVLLWALWTTRTGSAWWGRIAAGLILVVCAATLASYERHADVADSRGAARYLATHDTTGAPILVVGPEEVFPFTYYYLDRDHGRARVLGVPRDASLEVYAPGELRLTDTAQISARVRDAGNPREYWLLVSKRYIWGPDFPATQQIIDAYRHTGIGPADSINFTNLFIVHARPR